ncbi:MAG: GNAT family N-acetyltransferase [Salinivirgaceae bacterium]|nr:GNAT family N-acetyltransferase [Salinivirgaceae bacterium]
MDCAIRPLNNSELPLLTDFLYYAIFVPEGVEAPPREIVNLPELQVYIRDFGAQPHDHCLVAEAEGVVVGAVWVRDMPDYGHVADGVPSFAISVRPEHRGRGIGTKLMQAMLDLLRQKGYKKASLSVQKTNYAARMYTKLGFRTIGENDEEYIMVYEF